MVISPEKLQKQGEMVARLSEISILHYLQHVVIASDPEPKRFGACAEWWQREKIIAPKVGALEWIAGMRPDYEGPVSFMDILPRGHDKSSLEGRLVNWLLAFAKKPITGYLIAADLDQASLIIEAQQAEAKLNPWLNERLSFVKRKITGPAGTVEALPADAGSTYGLRGNVFIFDEVTHWPNDLMWKAAMSGRHKKDSIAIVISNAGLKDSWQDHVRRTVKQRPSWHVFEAPEGKQLASWMNAKMVEDVRATLPPSEADRVLGNRWIDPVEEADYLRRDEVEKCVDRTLVRSVKRDPKYKYVLSWDYGRVNDRSVGVVGHLDENNRCVIDVMDVFAGSKQRPIDIETVEAWIEEQEKRFHLKAMVFDPHQMEGTIQAWERKGKTVIRHTGRQGAANMEIAMILRSRIVNGLLVWYPGCGDLLIDGGSTETLADELAGLRVKRMPYGFRFDHETDMHDDRAVALGMLALYVSEYASITPMLNLPKIVIPQFKQNFWGRK